VLVPDQPAPPVELGESPPCNKFGYTAYQANQPATKPITNSTAMPANAFLKDISFIISL